MPEGFLAVAVIGSAAVAISFFIRSMTGFGAALIAVPLLSMLLDLKFVVPVEALLEVAFSLLVLRTILTKSDYGALAILLAFAVVGSLVGIYILYRVDTMLLKRIMGVALIGFAINMWFNRKATPLTKRQELTWGSTAGFGGGLLGGLFGTPGPPFVIYLNYRLTDKDIFRATLMGIMAADYAWRVVVFGFTGGITSLSLWYTLAWIPAMIIGTIVGDRAAARLNQARFRQIVVGLLVAAGLLMLFG